MFAGLSRFGMTSRSGFFQRIPSLLVAYASAQLVFVPTRPVAYHILNSLESSRSTVPYNSAPSSTPGFGINTGLPSNLRGGCMVLVTLTRSATMTSSRKSLMHARFKPNRLSTFGTTKCWHKRRHDGE